MAGCLVPQIVRTLMTRSARDISYIYLTFFIIGLSLMTVYLVNEEATVGYITIAIELSLASLLLSTKVFLDFFGPNRISDHRKNGMGLITSRAMFELKQFLKGKGGAPFPLIQEDDSHAAAHLLLDCQFPHHDEECAPCTISTGNQDDVEARGSDGPRTVSDSFENITEPVDFNYLVEELEETLIDAGVRTRKKILQSFPSFARASRSGRDDLPTTPTMSLIPCEDGYVTIMMYARNCSLAIDFVAASSITVKKMNAAASSYCHTIESKYPGTMLAASMVGRLPVRLNRERNKNKE